MASRDGWWWSLLVDEQRESCIGCVMRLLDSCYGNFVLEAHSVGNISSRGVVGRREIKYHVTS